MNLFKLIINTITAAAYQKAIFGQIAGAVIGGMFSARGAKRQQQASQGMSREQMDFQASQASTARDFNERMSSTAHQRQVSDLRAAGLNPILSANSGASSPSSPSPSGAMGQAQNVEGAGITSALNIYRAAAEIDRIEADTDLIKAKKDALGAPAAAGAAVTDTIGYIRENSEWFSQKAQEVIDSIMIPKSGVKMTPADISKNINAEFEKERPFGMPKSEAKEAVEEFLDQIPPNLYPDGRDVRGNVIQSEDYDQPGNPDRWKSPGTGKQLIERNRFEKIYPHQRKQESRPEMPWGDLSP